MAKPHLHLIKNVSYPEAEEPPLSPELPKPEKNYQLLGFWVLIIATLLAIIPVVYFFARH